MFLGHVDHWHLGVRAIMYRRNTGTWHVKGLGYLNFNDHTVPHMKDDPKGNFVFKHGAPNDTQLTPFVSNIFGDGRSLKPHYLIDNMYL